MAKKAGGDPVLESMVTKKSMVFSWKKDVREISQVNFPSNTAVELC